MPVLTSQVNPQSDAYKQNQQGMQNVVDDLQKTIATILKGGGEKYVARHKAKGKLLARERIDALLDADSPFLEIGQLAAHNVYGEDVPCAGVVAGIGLIHGSECMVVANDATVKGGSYYPLTVKKHLRA